MSRPKLGKAAITPGGPAAIYRRISHTRDEDQTGVDRQERLCRDIAERLQLRVEPTHVYMDNNRSAWQRNLKRPGVGGNAEGEGGRRDPARHRLPPRPPHAARDGRAIVEEEAEIVREVCRRYLDGESPSRIAQDLAARDILTSKGKTWNPESVRHLLSSPVRCRGRPPADEEGRAEDSAPTGWRSSRIRSISKPSIFQHWSSPQNPWWRAQQVGSSPPRPSYNLIGPALTDLLSFDGVPAKLALRQKRGD